jgi:flavin-dependent dehydrogenase
MATAGYFIPGTGSRMQIKFLQGLHGYIWIFPRANHLSAGICGKLGAQTTAELRSRLEKHLDSLKIDYNGARFYSHLLPSLQASTLRESIFCGEGWAMVGDAAGFVDPITGEGLYYAMRSAELLSQALLAERPQSYPRRIREDFLPDLEAAARMAEKFYSGSWMGKPVVERMVQFTACSSVFCRLMSDLFAGTQSYLDLRRRAYRSLPVMVLEGLMAAGAGYNPGSKVVRKWRNWQTHQT